jgi:hypothetical protein
MYSGLSSTTIKLRILYGHHVTSHFIKTVTPINLSYTFKIVMKQTFRVFIKIWWCHFNIRSFVVTTCV